MIVLIAQIFVTVYDTVDLRKIEFVREILDNILSTGNHFCAVPDHIVGSHAVGYTKVAGYGIHHTSLFLCTACSYKCTALFACLHNHDSICKSADYPVSYRKMPAKRSCVGWKFADNHSMTCNIIEHILVFGRIRYIYT